MKGYILFTYALFFHAGSHLFLRTVTSNCRCRKQILVEGWAKPWIIYMLHMDWKQLRKLHKIIHNGETVLVNMFMGITTIVYSEVLQMFV